MSGANCHLIGYLRHHFPAQNNSWTANFKESLPNDEIIGGLFLNLTHFELTAHGYRWL